MAPHDTAFTPPKVSPPPRPLSGLGLLRTMVRDPIAAIPAAAYEEPAAKVAVPCGEVVFVSEPALVDAILVGHHEAFPKSRLDERIFVPILGAGLLTASGEDWRWKRRLAAPAFRQRAVAAYLPAIEATFAALSARWAAAPGPQRINAATTAAALEVICRAMFSGFDQLDGRRLSAAIDRYLAPVSWSIAYATLGLPARTPHPGRLRMARAAAEARALVRGFVRRRQRGDRRDDLAQVLIEARDPATGRTLDEDELVDTFLTLLSAGHETSAHGLAWALYCLAEQPEAQAALAAEVRAAVGEGPIGPQHLPAMAGLERFVKEAMRLFPPVPLMARRAARGCRLGEVAIREGSTVFIPIYAIHRHRRLWERPDAFASDRFAAGEERVRHRCAYMPFGAGPRICIGNSFAMLEMVAGLAVLLRRLRFLPAGAARPQPVQRITLRPARELVLHVEPT